MVSLQVDPMHGPARREIIKFGRLKDRHWMTKAL
jgi:hypothetical protein